MSVLSTLAPLLVIGGVIAAIAWGIFRALLLDEIRGRIKRRAEANVKATLTSMSPELRAEYEEDWLGELDSLKSMPFSAIAFARGVRQSAAELMGAPALASAGADGHNGVSAGWRPRQITHRLGRFGRRLLSWSLVLRQGFNRLAGLRFPKRVVMATVKAGLAIAILTLIQIFSHDVLVATAVVTGSIGLIVLTELRRL